MNKISFLAFLLITQDNKIKKNSEHPFADIVKKEACTKFQQKLLNSMVVGALSKCSIF